MPRWTSRITLEVESVRVERLQEMGDEQACLEGVDGHEWHDKGGPRKEFARLWDTINAKRGFGWEVNPWVFVVTFKVVDNPTKSG